MATVFKFGAGGPKARLVTSEEKAALKAKVDQTGDLTALGAGGATSAFAPAPELAGAGGAGAFAPAVAAPSDVAEEAVAAAAALVPKPAKKPVAVPAPGAGAKAAPPKKQSSLEAAPVPKRRIDFTKFGEAEPFAIAVKSEEAKNPYVVKGSRPVYPLQTRMGFQKQILKVFQEFIRIPEFGKEIDYDVCKKMGAGAQQQVEMYEYQKFVREYVRNASPYRGLLVYHGLGSGKTCSAIAAAEALFSVTRKKIIVMTPSSLRYNFVREVTFCGFRHFRLQNHWVELDASEPTIKLFAMQILNLPETYVSKHAKIWVPDFGKDKLPNFQDLPSEDRTEITQQLETQIQTNIKFINYNGIKGTKLKALACRPPDKDGNTFFDNSVIVVDEIHNLTRLMQGTIEPYLKALPGLKRKIPLEPVTPGHWEPELCKKPYDPRRPYLTNYKRGYILYRLLVNARNSKIIGLSGTPLINFPEEIAILANLIGGYINTVSFTVKPGSEENKKAIEEVLNESVHIDFVEVEVYGTNLKVLFSILPEGMQKTVAADGTLGVQRLPAGTPAPSIQEITQSVVDFLAARGITVEGKAEIKAEPLLPPVGEDFREHFLEGETGLKNTVVLRKRLQGLVSYYRGSKKELMPTVTKDELVKVPMSPYVQTEYMKIRGEELRIAEKAKARGPPGGGAQARGKMANLWAEIYDLNKLKQPNSYRMASRQACNFAFPEGIVRPRPNNAAAAEVEIGQANDDTVTDGDAGAAGAEGEEGGAAVLGGAPADEEDAELLGDEAAARQEDEEVDDSAARAAVEEAKAAGEEEEAEELSKESETSLVPELPAAAAAGEVKAAAAATAPPAAAKGMAAILAKQAAQKEACKKGYIEGEDYMNATKRAKQCLKLFATKQLRLFPMGQNIAQKVAEKAPPEPTMLMNYSPKFAKMIVDILESPGSSLVYSQFLDMEGIGIFSTILDINDFHRIEILVDEDGRFAFSPATIANLKKPGVNRYLTFTGAQSAEKWKGSNQLRNMALKVFNARYVEDSDGSNGRYTDLSPELGKVLLEAGYKGNLKGDLCRVFCITSAGAEGLSLRNVRRVLIMEPYWNHVRTDQVKGRAVRICSHIDLDYSDDPALNQRTVEVYTYCSVFAPEAMLHPDGSAGYPTINFSLLNGDGIKPDEAAKAGFEVPAGAKDYLPTSDEYLYQMSERKKRLLSNIQDLMKTNAVDCKINVYENEDEGLGCITLPGNPSQYAYHPNLLKDIAETSVKFRQAEIEASAEKAPSAEEAAEGEEAPFGFEAAAPAPAEDEAGADAAPRPAPAAAKPVPAAPAGPKGRAKPTKQVFEIFYNETPYLAVPHLEKGQILPLTFDLYSRGDIRLTRIVGTAVADPEGNPTDDVELF